MATVQPLDHIDDAHWQAIFQTRYAHVTRIVRTYKDKLPLVIGGNMRRTTRQRRLCGKGRPGRYDTPGRETQGEHQHRDNVCPG